MFNYNLNINIDARNEIKLNPDKDRNLDRDRYDSTAEEEFELFASKGIAEIGLKGIEEYLSQPLKAYYEQIKYLSTLNEIKWVLELGSGTGRHSGVLIENFKNVITLDISLKSQVLCSIKLKNRNLSLNASMDQIPIRSNSIDLIVSSGSLSYADNEKLLNEITRIISNNGTVLFIDSLNHNLIYKFNRYLHFLKGKRTLSTIQRIPKINLIKKYEVHFHHSKFVTYQNFAWLYLILKKLNRTQANRIIHRLDKLKLNKKSYSKYGFKFIFFATKIKRLKSL